jgi:hypothetical protein
VTQPFRRRGAVFHRFMVGLSVLALFCVPTMAWAEPVQAVTVPVKVAELQGTRLGSPAVPGDVAPSEANNYAKREAATPKLGEFEGGGTGIYIGGGVLTVALLIVLIIVLLR